MSPTANSLAPTRTLCRASHAVGADVRRGHADERRARGASGALPGRTSSPTSRPGRRRASARSEGHPTCAARVRPRSLQARHGVRGEAQHDPVQVRRGGSARPMHTPRSPQTEENNFFGKVVPLEHMRRPDRFRGSDRRTPGAEGYPREADERCRQPTGCGRAKTPQSALGRTGKISARR